MRIMEKDKIPKMRIDELWGKYSAEMESYHPLICHMIDTASVAEAILDITKSELSDISFWTFLIALHDIGKATPGFQVKVPALAVKLEESGYDFPKWAEGDHSKTGQYFLSLQLEEIFGVDETRSCDLARVVTSHHGRFMDRFTDEPVDGNEKWSQSRLTIVETLRDLYGVSALPEKMPSAAEALWLMGLCSVADWIASNERYFPYVGELSVTLEAYRDESRQKADDALRQISWQSIEARTCDFTELFGFDAPNALQKAALEQAAFHGGEPMLMVIEGPMGEGKTEAALGAFAIIHAARPQRGLYFALPTQATSNMMYSRLEAFLKRFAEHPAQLHLLHANASLNEEYANLRLRSVYDEKGPVVASEWFLPKKRSLLASFGVGTVDQAEMAALQVRHFFVRLFALAGKTVIIDEVHAYDAYMSGILEVLLGWLRMLGTSVILLSATLPQEKKRNLIAAYDPDADMDALPDYPCVLSYSSRGRRAEHVDLPKSQASLYPLAGESWLESMVNLCRDKLARGGCAACVLNTVSDAQQLYRALRVHFPEEELFLFHARFTLEDRLKIERQIIQKFGKNGDRPERGIVVATQVIEQSLDVDFDLMLSQPAPIDLLLQRMGRLHRHEHKRPTGLEERILYVTVPPKLREVREDFGDSRFVYYPDILYKSLRPMWQEGVWREYPVSIPEDLAKLVKTVYDEPIDQEELASWEEEREGEAYAHLFLASQVAIPSAREEIDSIRNEYDDDADAFDAKTRLGEASLLLIPLADEAESEAATFSDAKALYERSVKVQTKWVLKAFSGIPTPESWKKWPMLRYAKAFVKGSVDGICYDNRLGLLIERKERQ